MVQNLPLEILEVIIDFCHDDSAGLRRYSLICSALVPVCRYHLFRELSITERDLKTETPNMLSVVSSPHLTFAAVVEILTLDFSEVGGDEVRLTYLVNLYEALAAAGIKPRSICIWGRGYSLRSLEAFASCFPCIQNLYIFTALAPHSVSQLILASQELKVLWNVLGYYEIEIGSLDTLPNALGGSGTSLTLRTLHVETLVSMQMMNECIRTPNLSELVVHIQQEDLKTREIQSHLGRLFSLNPQLKRVHVTYWHQNLGECHYLATRSPLNPAELEVDLTPLFDLEDLCISLQDLNITGQIAQTLLRTLSTASPHLRNLSFWFSRSVERECVHIILRKMEKEANPSRFPYLHALVVSVDGTHKGMSKPQPWQEWRETGVLYVEHRGDVAL